VERRPFWLVFALIFALRIAASSGPWVTYDVISYSIVAKSVAAGQNFYAATSRYNYSPLWAGIVSLFWRMADGRMPLFLVLVGLLLTTADALIALVLKALASERGASAGAARITALLYFANPVSVLVACYKRQFDGLSILFLLLAIRAVSRGTRRGRWESAAALAMSLLVKHVTALHPLLFWKRRRPGGLPLPLVLAPYGIFALAFLPFLAASGAIVENVLLYGTGLSGPRGQRPGGLQWLLFVPHGGRIFFFAAFLAAVGTAIAVGERLTLTRAALLLFLAELVFAPGFASQYVVWPLAIGSLFPSAGYVLLTTIGAAFIVGDAGVADLPVAVTPVAVWLAALFWLAQEARSAFEPSAGAGLQTSSTASA
jgi:hypothetical protein